jgi:hypothetical protein
VKPESIDWARKRLADAGTGHDPVELESALERTREALETFAARTAELEASVPERLDAAIRDGMQAEARPLGRDLAELRGLTNGTVRRLERLQADLDAERRARVEDLALLVDLIASGWRGVEGRLDRIERAFDRLERSLEERPVAELHRLEERQRKTS